MEEEKRRCTTLIAVGVFVLSVMLAIKVTRDIERRSQARLESLLSDVTDEAARSKDRVSELERQLKDLDALAVARRKGHDATERGLRLKCADLEVQLHDAETAADRREIAAEQRGRVEGARIAAEALRVDAAFRAKEAAASSHQGGK